MAETYAQRAERLADLIVDRILKNESCTDEDLFRAAFTTDDLKELAPRVMEFLRCDDRLRSFTMLNDLTTHYSGITTLAEGAR